MCVHIQTFKRPSERTVFEVYLAPWLKYAQAGGRGVMLSHNMALWTPMHANKRLVTDTLRNRFGLLNGYIGCVVCVQCQC